MVYSTRIYRITSPSPPVVRTTTYTYSVPSVRTITYRIPGKRTILSTVRSTATDPLHYGIRGVIPGGRTMVSETSNDGYGGCYTTESSTGPGGPTYFSSAHYKAKYPGNSFRYMSYH